MRDMKRSDFAHSLGCRQWYKKFYVKRVMKKFKNGKRGFDMLCLDEYRDEICKYENNFSLIVVNYV